MQHTILEHFENQFRSTNPNDEDISVALEGMTVRVSEDMGASLNHSLSVDEVRTSISQMHPYKSPGPDMSPVFFYKYWNMVAFVPDRLINDNILVSYEVNHFLAHKYWGSMGQVALKLDLGKAYDRVEWNFLERVLTKAELRRVRCVLGQLEATSSLMINMEKSLMTFSKNTTMEGRSELAAVFGVQIVEKHDKYLGLSAVVGRLKRAVFQYIKYRTWSKLQRWRCLNLSQAGRMVLLQLVIQSMPTFVMGCFLSPLSTCCEIESIMADFFWNNKEHRHIYWIAWPKLCSKKEDRGPGFRRLHLFNQALVAKKLWRIIMNPDCLMARALKHKYFPIQTFFLLRDGQNVSIWRDRWISRPVLFKVLTAPHSLEPNVTVSALLMERGQWNEELISAMFVTEDAVAILSIPVKRGMVLALAL
ncbi:UNVERIFIED_CONTAM: hypothetical protein Slati_3882300 [Sesamum latifolium]|uniref:Reverse transcriptase n=1 Tax=Sesamum latifolium TaxID=2727402 RepID=A0AAW2TM41_9LAMI